MRRDPDGRRIAELVRKVGAIPQCLAHYEPGNEQCDGVPCTWRWLCRLYRDFCDARGIDPKIERDLLPEPVFLRLLQTVSEYFVPAKRRPPPLKVYRGWQRFLGALTLSIPHLPIQPRPELALPREAYVTTWRDSLREGQVKVYSVKVRSDTLAAYVRDRTLLRYRVNGIRRVRPTIEIRCPLERLLERYPEAADLADRWRYSDHQRPLGSCAVRVKTERIEDVARLVAALLRDRMIVGLRLKRGGIKYVRVPKKRL